MNQKCLFKKRPPGEGICPRAMLNSSKGKKKNWPAQKKEKILKDTLLQNFGLETINPLDYNKKEHNITYPGTIGRFFLNTGFLSNVLAKLKGPPCIRTRVLYTVISLHLSSI